MDILDIYAQPYIYMDFYILDTYTIIHLHIHGYWIHTQPYTYMDLFILDTYTYMDLFILDIYTNTYTYVYTNTNVVKRKVNSYQESLLRSLSLKKVNFLLRSLSLIKANFLLKSLLLKK